MADKLRFLGGAEGPVTGMASWQATSEERARAIPVFRARRIIAELDRSSARDVLVTLFELANGTAPSRQTKTPTLVNKVTAAIAAERLLLVEGWELGQEVERRTALNDDLGSPAERLARTVMGHRPTVTFEGQRLRFVSAEVWFRGHNRSDYRVVPEAQARDLLKRMSKQLATSPADKAAWKSLGESLADRFKADAILLTQFVPPSPPPPRDVSKPVVTPSQARPPEKEKDWIEVKILFEDGTAFDGDCVIVLPDGRKTDGAPNDAGVVRIDGLDPGSCKLSFPSLDAAAAE